MGISVSWTGMRGRTHHCSNWVEGKTFWLGNSSFLRLVGLPLKSSWRMQLLNVDIISISSTLRSPLAWKILRSSNIPNSCYFKGRARKGGTFTDRCCRKKSCRISRKRKGSFHDNHLQPAPPVSAECENTEKRGSLGCSSLGMFGGVGISLGKGPGELSENKII